MSATSLAQTIKDLARQMGFAAVGFAPAGPVPHTAGLKTWLKHGYCADTAYMRRHLPKRLCPAELVDGARSVICLAASYAPGPGDADGLVARYARGQDYHDVLKRRCTALMQAIGKTEPGFQGRAFVDSAPVMERSLAAAAGLGWVGRNGCLFINGAGSYCVLAEIICNLPLPPDRLMPPRCGDCRACLDACPTGALKEDGLVDARRCISYLTIEHRGPIDSAFWPRMGTRLFGCDACQSVCPHNRDAPAGDAELTGENPLGGAGLAEVLAWSVDDWHRATAGASTQRAKHEQFIRNAIIAAGNSSDARLVEPLAAYQPADATQAECIRWARGRLAGGE